VSANDIPENIRQFISRYIGTVNDLEVLLMLMQVRREWTALEVGERVYLDEDAAGVVLSGLVASGLVEATEGDPVRYRYMASEDTYAVIQSLADTYARMRVRVIELIYQSPTKAIKSFAEAFKIKQEKE
jgi:predicted transcriptional regulator